ncbi:MAG: hypothetical protein M1837_006137 [Sclerophora amabilis]|nr:MAG: hypothetical protein M1837_006137 [Sclerophora amabilis]
MDIVRSFRSLRRSFAVANLYSYQSLARRSLAPLFRHQPSPPATTVLSLPSKAPIEEETIPDYSPEHFYPANPGDLLHDRYEVTAKLGWGTSSVVWLARDLLRWRWQSERYVALKIMNCDFADQAAAEYELEMSGRLAKGDPQHHGFRFVRTALDSFETSGSHGKHVCLVYEPMRETLSHFQRRIKDGRFPLLLLKASIRLLLMGLDYLHSECQMVHTDLKLENVLLGFESSDVLHDFVHAQRTRPMLSRKPAQTSSAASLSGLSPGRYTYRSQNEFGPLRSSKVLPKIADFGAAQLGNRLQIHPIQPHSYRAPEVLLGIGWSYKADIWNLGVMMWNLLENRDLFTPRIQPGRSYSPAAHLAEMIALLGPPPQTLIMNSARSARQWTWSPTITNPEGKLCERVEDYYGGPFWDYRSGEFLYKELIPSSSRLEDSVPSIQDAEDKRQFLDFVRGMLRWVPEERKTAKDLLEDPWLAPPTDRG